MDWKSITKDAFSTLIGSTAGILSGALYGAIEVAKTGNVSQESLAIGAGIGAAGVLAGYLHNKGNQEKRFK